METDSKFFVCARCGSAHNWHPFTASYSGYRGEINLALCSKCFEDARNLNYGEIASTAQKITDAVDRDAFEFNSLLDFIKEGHNDV